MIEKSETLNIINAIFIHQKIVNFGEKKNEKNKKKNQKFSYEFV